MDGTDTDLLTLAVEAFKGGDAARAESLFRAVLAADPANGVAHHQLGVLAISRGDMRAGIEHLTHAAALAPWEPEYHNNLGAARKASQAASGSPAAFSATPRLLWYSGSHGARAAA